MTGTTAQRVEALPAQAFGGRAFALASLAYSALAIALTFPLILRTSTVVPHDVGDPLLSIGILWWNAHVLPFTERWWNGFAFYPAPGFLAFSDPRLGESLLATPLQWLGCSPVVAYNLTLLATYPLSALAAHWLGFVLTRRHDAAAVAGLAFGFCPFRGAHLSHLELLAAFGMPAALVALHRFKDTGGRRWLAVFGLALVVQGLCSSYYLLFFSVLVGAWLLWFIRRGDTGRLIGIVLAGICALVVLSPLALGYSRVHGYYGLERRFDEIVAFSADATSLFAADPGLKFWGWTSRFGEREGLLFPGATISLLTLVCALWAWWKGMARDRLDRVSLWLLPVAALFAAIAAAGWAYAPWRMEIPGLTVSSDAPFKSMSIAVLLAIVWLGMSSAVRRAWRQQSAFAFYVLATALMFLCSFGPKPMFAGHQFLYRPPYSWLMEFPVFDSIRVTARFGMPAMLALAVAGAIAFDRLRLQPASRRVLAAVLLIGIAADGWLSPITLAAVPETWPASRAKGFNAVLELPFGDLFGDLAATYRAIDHKLPIINGSSGFEPTHYFALRTALEERDPTAFDWLAGDRVLVVIDTRSSAFAEWDRFLGASPMVTRLEPDEPWAFYALEPPRDMSPPCTGAPAELRSITDGLGPLDLGALTDGNPHTWWQAPHPQRAGDSLVLELARTDYPCAVVLSAGEFRRGYPRRLIVETSRDGAEWSALATRRTAGLTIRAALDDPKRVAFSIPLTPQDARFVRLRLDEDHPEVPWQVTDLQVLVAPTRDR